ncbi:MAG: ISL3 family transposase, partial [Acidobacteriota bacterium]
MLVESLARKTLGVKDHRVMKAVEEGATLVIRLDRRRGRRLPCSVCGARSKVRDRLPERRWQHVPLWGIPVTLAYRPARVRCLRCGVHVEKIPWAEGKSPLTGGLVHVLAVWARLLSWDVVASLFGLSWGSVASAVKAAVHYGLEHRDTSEVCHIGIDEISRRKGHQYMTQVYDLAQKRLLWSGEGRGEETLKRFFDEWGPERTEKIEGICCDMWAPYVKVIRERCPDAVVVFDKFHLVRHLLEAVDTVRKMEARALKAEEPGLLKGTKYLWLKNPWNLSPKQRQRLGFLERLNLRVHRAYLLKELFRELWNYRRKAWAARYLKKWFWWATHSRLKPLRDFAWMLRRHEKGILAYFQLRIDNGAVEAMNNNAKQISHRAHGFRT